MMARRSRRSVRISLVAAAVVAVLALLSTGTSAQLILQTPTPAPPTPTPTPTLTPPPTPSPSPEPIPTVHPKGIPGKGTPAPDDAKVDDKKKDETDDLTGKLEDKLPDGLETELVVPNIARTRPRNTANLVSTLRPLADVGYPLEQVLIDGMGRFPVAGLARYFDDWLNPRFTPKPHLHHGLDIFADFGTPIRSPDRGVVSSLPSAGAGGIGVWVRGSDGVAYYFAHMLERAEGIHVGQRVNVGTVLGYVGDTGNAQGGTPHLHFEIHPGGGEAIPPKPTVDAWLDEAEQIAPQWVDAKRTEIQARGNVAPRTAAVIKKREEIETQMLLTLLDPVGGSVGMLPSLEVEPRRNGVVSDRLLDELVKQRVRGDVFIPSGGGQLY
jgi:murein DD-endopeptidase MepM/ murein hydrolase activator NlpD